MKLQITTSNTNEVDVPVPSYYKSPEGHEYRGVLSETDYREVWQLNNLLMLTMSSCEERQSAIGMAIESWERISELEFITRMDEAIASFFLTPTLKL